jgi:hypothetical protein
MKMNEATLFIKVEGGHVEFTKTDRDRTTLLGVVFSYSLHPFFLVFRTSKIVKICTNKFVPMIRKKEWRVTLSSRSCKEYSRTRPSPPMWRTAASDPYISAKYKTNCLGGALCKKTIKCLDFF